jgi:glycosyltransferase involved in cell wall biosynthesis
MRKVANTAKHVCMINYSNYVMDTRVRRAAETIAALPAYKVSVLTLKQSEHPKQYTLNGVNVRELNIAKYRGKSGLRYISSYGRFMVLAFIACTKLLLRESVDIVHVHNMPNFIVFAATLPRIVGKKVILDIHDTMIETYFAKFQKNDTMLISRIFQEILKMEESLSCKMAHRIICVNHVQKDALLKRGIPEEKMIVSLNVPDPERLKRQQAPSHGYSSNGKFNLVYHGTMAKRLGIDLAIRAIAELSTTIPDIIFHVVGEGDDLEEFMQLSRELRAEQFVRFSGKSIPFEELVGLLRTMEAGLVPNRQNAATELMLPIKLLECVAIGVPVIVPRLKAIEYYFTDDMVTYFEPENMDSLVNSIRFAYKNRSLIKEKTKNAVRFMDTYRWDRHKFELINLYRSLVESQQETVSASNH